MKHPDIVVFLLSALLALSGCSANAKKTGTWERSSLPTATIDAIRADGARYQSCIDEQVKTLSTVDIDSRAATDLILQACESMLNDTRKRFLEQEVPESIADRYLKRKRTQTARRVLFEMMRLSAMRESMRRSQPSGATESLRSGGTRP